MNEMCLVYELKKPVRAWMLHEEKVTQCIVQRLYCGYAEIGVRTLGSDKKADTVRGPTTLWGRIAAAEPPLGSPFPLPEGFALILPDMIVTGCHHLTGFLAGCPEDEGSFQAVNMVGPTVVRQFPLMNLISDFDHKDWLLKFGAGTGANTEEWEEYRQHVEALAEEMEAWKRKAVEGR